MSFDAEQCADKIFDAMERLHAKRLGALENRIAAIEAGQKADPQIEVTLASLERRCSRNADHAQALESRMRKLEGRG